VVATQGIQPVAFVGRQRRDLHTFDWLPGVVIG
jgi:hypothetical protein